MMACPPFAFSKLNSLTNMSKIKGRFYFKLTDSKNLIGEFSNNESNRNYTESADLDFRNSTDSKFIGTYFTTWHEDDKGHESVLAKLKIEHKHPDIYKLTWWQIINQQPSAKPSFEGEGMLCDGILIGDYQYVGK
jgi:hypothetical protein